jgi:hypothetical protein
MLVFKKKICFPKPFTTTTAFLGIKEGSYSFLTYFFWNQVEYS